MDLRVKVVRCAGGEQREGENQDCKGSENQVEFRHISQLQEYFVIEKEERYKNHCRRSDN